MDDTTKKRRLEANDDGDNAPDHESAIKPLPFTCICYDGRFYTTDDCGHFIHASNDCKNKLMRCEVDEECQQVQYTFIRSLSDNEVATLENVEDINVVNDLTKFNKSLYY